jgi:hypothetical protein
VNFCGLSVVLGFVNGFSSAWDLWQDMLPLVFLDVGPWVRHLSVGVPRWDLGKDACPLFILGVGLWERHLSMGFPRRGTLGKTCVHWFPRYGALGKTLVYWFSSMGPWETLVYYFSRPGAQGKTRYLRVLLGVGPNWIIDKCLAQYRPHIKGNT